MPRQTRVMPKNACSKCDGLKDVRAALCAKCRFIHNHPRLGTGQGWVLHSTGYMTSCISGKPRYQHRYVMEKHLKRQLRSDEHVHHKDGDKTNNALNNLEVLDCSEHQRLHMTSEQSRKISPKMTFDRAKEMSIKGHKARWGYETKEKS